MTETRADHLIFLSFDFKNLRGEVIYNGPEHDAIQLLPKRWDGQRMVSMTKIRLLDAKVEDTDGYPWCTLARRSSTT